LKPVRTAIYGSCHADALRRVLQSDPGLAARLEFVPLSPCMEIGEAEMAAFLADQASSLDLFIYQPISADYRGPQFSSASIIERAGASTSLLSFSYYHLEVYAPFILASAAGFPPGGPEYVDYLLASLVHQGLDETRIVEELAYFQAFEPYAPRLIAQALFDLRWREERLLDGDRPIDIRLSDRVEAHFRDIRLGHTANHPTAPVFQWLAEDVAGKLSQTFGLDPSSPAPVDPDPLDDVSYFAAPFVARALELTFTDAPIHVLEGHRLALSDYVARQRPYYETVPRAMLAVAIDNLLSTRPWFAALLDGPPRPSATRAVRKDGRLPPRIQYLAIRFDDGVKPEAMGPGWSIPEPAGIWSDGEEAWLEIAAPDAEADSLLLQVLAMGHGEGAAAQRVGVAVGGRLLATWSVRHALWTTYGVVIPKDLFHRGRPLRLSLTIPGAVSPGPGDRRRLGIALQQLTLSH
jgi:hypothetical protein